MLIMLSFYSIYHINIMYSSIEKERRSDVIKKCYWPIFDLADLQTRIGLEAPGVTLEIINEIDPDWIEALSYYINAGKIEFIGSGYSQIIGPLVPAEVNDWNQRCGIETYFNMLGVRPRIGLINEMAYSAGLVEHYHKYGYKAVVMEWNNPRSGHPEWNNEWRYYPQMAKGCAEYDIQLIWADSIAFQKFQRYAHGDYEFQEYIDYLRSKIGSNDRYFPIYSSDAEIFNFRPGRYNTEKGVGIANEWDRIINIHEYLNEQNWCNFVFPSEVLHGIGNQHGGNVLKLESPAQPIPVKKQEKYNVNRWALSGRDDLGINTTCYHIYRNMLKKSGNEQVDWSELCYLWSSDFRTHITSERWREYIDGLEGSLNGLDRNGDYEETSRSNESNDKSNRLTYKVSKNSVEIEGEDIFVLLSKSKGLTIKEYKRKKVSSKPLFGTLDHGFFEDISLGADYFSGHSIIERPGEHKIADLNIVEPEITRLNDCICITSQQHTDERKFTNRILIYDDSIEFEKHYESRKQSFDHLI